MEKQITAVALVLSVAGLGYLKAQQMERMEAQAERDAAAAVIAAEEAAEAHDESSRVQFEVPHDRDASTSDMDIVLDGMASYDAEWIPSRSLGSKPKGQTWPCLKTSPDVHRSVPLQANTPSN